MPTKPKPTTISLTERELFWRRMHALVSRGSPLIQSMEIAAGQSLDAGLRRAVVSARDAIIEGGPMSRALQEQKGVFSPTEVELIRVGEVGGKLDSMCGTLADMFRDGLVAAKWQVLPASNARSKPVMITNAILTTMVKKKVREVVLSPVGGGKLGVKYRTGRKGGKTETVDHAPGVVSHLKIMGGLDVAEKRKAQKGVFGVRVDGVDAAFSVTTTPSPKGEGCVLKRK